MAMGDAKPSVLIPMPSRDRDRDRDLLVPPAAADAHASPSTRAGAESDDDESKPSSASAASAAAQTGREAFHKVVHSWASKKFMTGCVILFPIAVTFYVTWWFFRFVDGFFSPIYAHLGINIFGLGFVTSIAFIFVPRAGRSAARRASVRALPPPGTTARRDPRRAELFRRLDAACDARRGEPPSPLPPPPPPDAPEEDDQPIWPPRSRYWERYKSLRNRESNPENSMIGPTENSVSLASGKRQKTSSDKDGDQYDGASLQVVICGNEKTVMGQDEQSESHFALEPSKTSKRACASVKKIVGFAVQCAKCQKWRLVSTKEKYEEIRERIREDPFVCEKTREWKPDVTCNDPSDVSQDGSMLWAIDKPDIAQAPQGWERLVKIRGEGSTKFADVYYRSPTGIQLRSTKEVEKYLAEHPEYVTQGVELSHFSFKSPAPLQKDYVKKRSQTSQSAVTQTGSNKLLQPKEVQPISWAAPPENSKQTVDNEDQPEAVQFLLALEKLGSCKP